MNLSTLSLEHFRNIEKAELEFDSGVNIFLGANGQGKTNLLEAIYTLSLTRPFRSREKEVFLEHESQFGKIKGEVQIQKSEKETLEILWENFDLKRNGTIFRRNGVEKNSTSYLESKHFFAVLFAPEDMELAFAAPKRRRQYISRALSPLFPDYLEATLNYEKILRHRNKLLSSYHTGKIKKMEFDFWDSELTKWSKVLIKYRWQFVDFVTNHLESKYRELSQHKDGIEFRFLPSILPEADFFDQLTRNFRQDTLYRSTQKGPHRDDFQILLRGKPLEEVASRGEVRTAMIALKLCERDFVAEVTSFFPVLLLDDVFSELDEERRIALLEIFKNDQVFITTTDLPKLSAKKKWRVFRVKNGKFELN